MTTAPDDRVIRNRWVPALLLLALVVAVFRPAADADFIWDDNELIKNNHYLRDWSYLGRNLTRSFWSVGSADDANDGATPYFRPIVTLSFMVDYALHGNDPRGYHLHNVVLHTLVVLLAFLFLCGPLGVSPWIAFGGTMPFALHPSRVESVCWISGRTDLFLGVFFMVGLFAFERVLSKRATRRAPWMITGFLAYGLALLTKETAVAFVPLLLALDFIVLMPRRKQGKSLHSLWAHGLLVTITLIFVAARLSQHQRMYAVQPTAGFWGQCNLALTSLGYYLDLVVRPYQPNAMIAAYFDARHVDLFHVAFGVAGVVLAVWAGIRFVRRGPRAVWGLAAFFLPLVPVLHLFPLPLHALVAERFLYLPMFGIAILLAVALEAASLRLRRVLVVTVGVLAVTWAGTSYLRCGDYRSGLRFWQATVAADESNPLAQQQLALEMVQAGNQAAAESHVRAALASWRRVGSPRGVFETQLLFVDLRLKRAAASDTQLRLQALSFLRVVTQLGLRPATVNASFPVGEDTLTIPSGVSDRVVVVQRPRSLALMGDIASQLGQDDVAVQAFRQAVDQAQDDWTFRLGLAIAQARALQLGAAGETLNKAAALGAPKQRIDPLRTLLSRVHERISSLGGSELPDAKIAAREQALAEVYVLLRAPIRAASFLRRVIARRPGELAPYGLLAMELATGGDWDASLDVIRQAEARLGPSDALRELHEQAQRAFEAWQSRR